MTGARTRRITARPPRPQSLGWVLEAGTDVTEEGVPAGGQEEGNDRVLAQAIQEEEDTDATATE
eukprot:11661086-Heterocapsa_arctica.AAC.1